MYANSKMQKSMTTMNPIVPDNGWTDYQIGRRMTSKNGQSGRCVQRQNKQHARRAEDGVAEATNSGGPDAIVYGDHDAIVGHELVRQYYTVLYNAPEHLWRFYDERAQYCHVNRESGLRVVVTGLPHVRGLLDSTTEKGHDRRPVVVESVNTVRCAQDQLLVMATSEHFVQSFVVQIKMPRTFTVVASIVQPSSTARPSAPAAPAAPPAPAADGLGTKTDRNVAACPSSGDRRLFIGHLSCSTTSEQLRIKFSEFGEVVNARVISGQDRSGRPTKFNYGFVTFSKPDGVDAVLASQPIKMSDGNRVNVNRTRDRR